MWVRAVRFMTAIAVIGICGFAAARGWSIMGFSLVMMDKSSENREETVLTWTAVPGVASTAWHAVLKSTINFQRDGLVAALSIKPLSSLDWLWLSGLQLATDQPIDTVLESLKLSMLTGPHEGDVMAERGIFGLSVWDALPEHLKDRTVTDLALGTISSDRGKLRTALSAEPEKVRSDLRTRLLAEGLLLKDLEQIGF